MSEYTPTTEEIRNGFIAAEHEANPHIFTDDIQADFYRWLASVKAKAWEEGAQSVTLTTYEEDGEVFTKFVEQPNPYREETK